MYFGFDSSEIDAQGQAVLNQQAQFLQKANQCPCRIAGHTDERGSREYNLALGERRAQAAQAYLATSGVSLHVWKPSATVKTNLPILVMTKRHGQNRRAEISY